MYTDFLSLVYSRICVINNEIVFLLFILSNKIHLQVVLRRLPLFVIFAMQSWVCMNRYALMFMQSPSNVCARK